MEFVIVRSNMGNLQDHVYKMWKEAAERKPALPEPQVQKIITEKKVDPLLDIFPQMPQKKNFLNKPSPEEIARRIFNNSKNKRRFL